MSFRSYYSDYNLDPVYIDLLYTLQVELLKLQKFVYDKKLRVAILFEGRDTAGKGSAIFRFTQFLNPRQYRVVALGKPTKQERGQWYFQRYIKELPNPGEMVFFDRSWYNRAVVEPVMGFCTDDQYVRFLREAPRIEKFLIEDGMVLIKFWFSIEMETQKKRIENRLNNPLKRWKVSDVDLLAQEKWEAFTYYKEKMFTQTHTPYSPWIIVNGNQRELGRINAIRYVLKAIDYPEKSTERDLPDAQIIFPFSL